MIKTLVLLTVTATAFAFCMQAGVVSLLTWVWLSLMMPQSEAWSSVLLNYSNMIAGIFTIIALFSVKERKIPKANAFTVLFFLFAIIIIISHIFSKNREISYHMLYVGSVTLFMSFAVLLLINTKVKIQALVWVVVLSLGYYGVTRGLYTIAGGGAGIVSGPAGTVITDNNQLAVALASTAPLAYYLFRITADKWVRWLAAGIFALSIVAVIGTHSRGGLISLGVLVLSLIARAKNKFLYIAVMLVVAGGTLLIMPPTWFNRMDTIGSAETDGSFMGRVEAWAVAYRIALENPILGVGARVHYFPEYNHHVAPEITVSGRPYIHRATHNAYFEIMAGNGFLALGAFLGMMATTFFWCGKIMRLTRNKPGFLWANELASMLQLSLLVFGVGTMALSMEFWAGFWINMVLAVNLREIVLRELKAIPDMAKQEAYA